MNSIFIFLLNSVLFGIGLAMDAFSVSLANGLHEPDMDQKRSSLIAGTFALFQTAMPLIGWVCVHTIVTMFTSFHKYIPWIALLLLSYIGGKMLLEGLRGDDEDGGISPVSAGGLVVQGIATSIDALSVGFTIADDPFWMAMTESLIIGVITFFICLAGLHLGRKIGVRISSKASILGGVILIAIGIEIMLSSIL